jgi:hypothetical protein
MKGRSGGLSNGTNALLAGGAVGALTGGASTPTLTTCPPDDKSFYCKLVRFVNTIKLFITIILIIGAIAFGIWFAYSYIKNMRKLAKK